jgi:hypothetical protein
MFPVLRTWRRKKTRAPITQTETRKLFENWKEKSGVEARKSGKRKRRTLRISVENLSKGRIDFFSGFVTSKEALGSSI